MLDHVPSVEITHDRNELKLYNGNIVYLNNGDNFELRFFNPLKEKIGVEIVFNGIKKGDGLLVLNPGQDLTLDRFLDEQRKMLFETYKVDGNNQKALEAIQENGSISFNFYREAFRSNKKYGVDVNYDFPPKRKKPYYEKKKYKKQLKKQLKKNWSTSGISGSGISDVRGPQGVSGCSGTVGTVGSYNTLGNINGMGSTTTSSVYHMNSNISYTSSFSPPGISTWENDMSEVTLDSLEVETGRVEKGDISDQRLKTINAEFHNVPFHNVSYKILPYSEMNKTSNEIRQYCGFCSYRLRNSKWKYCPKCGSSI